MFAVASDPWTPPRIADARSSEAGSTTWMVGWTASTAENAKVATMMLRRLILKSWTRCTQELAAAGHDSCFLQAKSSDFKPSGLPAGSMMYRSMLAYGRVIKVKLVVCDTEFEKGLPL